MFSLLLLTILVILSAQSLAFSYLAFGLSVWTQSLPNKTSSSLGLKPAIPFAFPYKKAVIKLFKNSTTVVTIAVVRLSFDILLSRIILKF